jgi:hypothetical protein
LIEFDEDPELLDIAKQINRARRPDRSGQVRRMTGTLRAWNPGTLQGVVELPGGQLVTNPPVMAALDAMSWAPGDEVILDLVPGSGGFSSVMILGRVFRPNAANSARVLQALQNDFAKQIAAEVFADRIKNNIVEENEVTSSTDWTDLDTPGPRVTEVEVTATGVMLVILGCSINVGNNGGYMSFELTGPTNLGPFEGRAAGHGVAAGNTFVEASRLVLVEGLAPGSYTVTAKYKVPNGGNVAFNFRTLSVIAV